MTKRYKNDIIIMIIKLWDRMIMDKVLDYIKHIALQYNSINKVILFGSRARGDNTDKSDYDIAVFSNNINISEQSKFLDNIDNIKTLNKIDVVFIREKHIGTELYQNIINDGVIIMDKFQTKLNNYTKALVRLHEAIEEEKISESLAVRDGAIKRFEFTAELAWKTIREYLLTESIKDINSPKKVMMEAFNNDIINDADGWIQILDDRNSTSHIYDEDDANVIFNRITTQHIILFDELSEKLSKVNN